MSKREEKSCETCKHEPDDWCAECSRHPNHEDWWSPKAQPRPEVPEKHDLGFPGGNEVWYTATMGDVLVKQNEIIDCLNHLMEKK